MGLSFGHLVIILIIILVLFGAGKLPQMMSDMGKGLKAFKNGVKEEEDDTSTKPKLLSKTNATPSLKQKAPVKTKDATTTSKKAEPKAKRTAAQAKNKI